MSNTQKNEENGLNSRIFKELEEFEKELAKTRKRTRDADFLDRKLVISDSTEFERHFENLSETIARLLPYHTFYTDEIKFNVLNEDKEQVQGRKDRIRKIQDSIMDISLGNSSLIFNASKYGCIRLLYSSLAMELEKNKKELSQRQALELNWRYPIDTMSNSSSVNISDNNNSINYISNKQYLNTSNATFNSYKHKPFEHMGSQNSIHSNSVNNHTHSENVNSTKMISHSKYYIDLPSNGNLKVEYELNKDCNYLHITNGSQSFQKQTQQNPPTNSLQIQQR